MKILSGTRFQWIAYNTETKKFMATGGGTYTTLKGKYKENIEFFSRDNSKVGLNLEFDYEILIKTDDKKLVNETLSEFITQELSKICLSYVESTGDKPPEALIKNMTFLLYNAYNKKQILRCEQNE